MDSFPGWVELVIEAVSSHRLGTDGGPLAAAQFTVNDLESLGKRLKLGTTVFANLARRERDLAAAIRAMGYRDGLVSPGVGVWLGGVWS